MKKVLFFAGAIALIFAFSSCKKDYTCECTTSMNGVGSGTASTTIHDTKTKATNTCEDGSSTYNMLGISYVVTCKIK